MFGLKSFVRRGKKDKKLIIKKTVIKKKQFYFQTYENIVKMQK